MVTFSFRAIPKTFSDGMMAWLEVQNENIKFTFGPYAPQGQTFSGEAEVALTDDISLYIVFEAGGKRETQLLDTYSGLYSQTLPSVQLQDSHLMYAEAPDGVLTLSDSYIMVRPDDTATAIKDLQAFLSRHGYGYFKAIGLKKVPFDGSDHTVIFNNQNVRHNYTPSLCFRSGYFPVCNLRKP